MGQKHLNLSHREIIARLLEQNLSKRGIAKILGYSAATICKEIQRNSKNSKCYEAVKAQEKTQRRRRLSHRVKTKQTDFLVDAVLQGLQRYWSPEQIAGRLRRDNPTNRDLWVSFKTIYRWLKISSYAQIPTVFTGYSKYLRIKGPGKVLNRRDIAKKCWDIKLPTIEQRPDTSSFGHWECDLIHGRRSSGYVLTAVERSTGLILAALCPKRDIPSVKQAILGLFSVSRQGDVKTFTYDRGKEFLGFKEIDSILKTESYFCHPYSPQERGLNENTNGLLRQFFPKSLDFSTINDEDIRRSVMLINDRPRKKNGFKTTVEVLKEKKLERLLTLV